MPSVAAGRARHARLADGRTPDCARSTPSAFSALLKARSGSAAPADLPRDPRRARCAPPAPSPDPDGSRWLLVALRCAIAAPLQTSAPNRRLRVGPDRSRGRARGRRFVHCSVAVGRRPSRCRAFSSGSSFHHSLAATRSPWGRVPASRAGFLPGASGCSKAPAARSAAPGVKDTINASLRLGDGNAFDGAAALQAELPAQRPASPTSFPFLRASLSRSRSSK